MNLTIFPSALQSSIGPNQFNSFLILGYSVMALVVLVYIISLAVRQRNVRRDVELMEHLLQDDNEERG